MLDAEKLQELKDRHIISEEELVEQKHRLAAKIMRKGDKIAAKNGIVYIVLAFFFGAIGVHNFYARYWKRGLVQFLLALISPYMLFVPLIFTSFWAMMELLFVNHGPDRILFRGNHRVIWALRILAVLSLVLAYSSADLVVQDMDMQMLPEI